MKCRICQTEINTNDVRQDGALICPKCGTIYRRKAHSALDQEGKKGPRENGIQDTACDSPVIDERVPPQKTYVDNDELTASQLFPVANPRHMDNADQWEEHPAMNSNNQLVEPKERNNNSDQTGKKKKATFKGIVFIVLVFLAVLIIYLLTTGKISLPVQKANNTVTDPNIDVISIIPDQSLPETKEKDGGQFVVVIANGTEIHSTPELSSAVVGIVNRGDQAKYLGQFKEEEKYMWYEIDREGTKGWISSLLSVVKEDSTVGNDSDSLQQSSILSNLKVTEDSMLNLLISTNTHLCFTVQCNASSSDKIYLVRADTNEIIGQMKDDGKDEDAVAGDGIYSFGFNVNGDRYGRAVFRASYDNTYSNNVTIRFYEKITEDQLTTAELMLQEMYSISTQFSNGNDYFTDANVDNIDKALDAVESRVSELYRQGKVAEYNRDDFSVYFKDAVTGIPMVYCPPIEGTKGSGDDTTITAFFPYASDGMAMDAVLSSIYMLDTEFDHVSFETKNQYSDGAVNPDQIVSAMGKNQVIFWDGHGGYNSEIHSFLITGKNSNDFYVLFHSDDFRNERLLLSGDNRVAITSKFIDKHCGDLSGSFVFISSCHSMQDNTLATSFLNKGASVVCGFTETVYIVYEKAILKEFFTNMTRVNPDTGKYHTVMEAMRRTVPYVSYTDNQYLGLKYPDSKTDPKESATLSFTGDPDYRFAEYGISNHTVTPTTSPNTTPTPSQQSQTTAAPQINISDFNIIGKWKSVGTYGFGQAQPGTIVIFDGTYCNFYSPKDTYSVYQSGGKLVLDITSLLFRENLMFDIQVVDNDHIRVVYSSNSITELTRVN